MSESAAGSSETPLPDSGAAGDLGTRAATAPFHLSQEPFTPAGPLPSPVPGYTPAPAFEHLGELPATYGTQSLYLVAYDPRQLFTYWDIDWAAANSKGFSLEVHCADGSVETRIDLNPPEASRYIAINQPGARYSVQLNARGRDGQWRPLATSGFVTMPPEGVAQETEPAFATLPFHLSFQRLIDLLKGAMRPQEDLTDVLTRLQDGGQQAATTLLEALGSLGDDQLRTLEMLAREGLQVPPADAGKANSFGRFAGGGSENLSSSGLNSEVRLAAAAAGAEALTSGAFGSQGRWLTGGLSSESLSSGGRQIGPLLSARGMGKETLSSSGRGLSSESYGAAAARGSEIMGSAARPGGFGLSSEAWRRAGGAAAGSSESLASNPSSVFVRAVESNLAVLGALFSSVDSQLSGERGGSSSTSSGRW